MSSINAIDFTFKPLDREDLPLFEKWIMQEHVKAWWPVPKEGETISDFIKRLRPGGPTPYMALIDSKPIGCIQTYVVGPGEHINNYIADSNSRPLTIEDFPEITLGIDQFIGEPNYIGKGYGTLMIKQFIEFLTQTKPGLKAVILDPEPINSIAIRSYEKVGFQKLGTYNYKHGLALLMRYDVV